MACTVLCICAHVNDSLCAVNNTQQTTHLFSGLGFIYIFPSQYGWEIFLTQIFIHYSKLLSMLYSLIFYERVNFLSSLFTLLLLSFFLSISENGALCK